MGMQCWDYLDTVEVIGSIPVAPIRFPFYLNDLLFSASLAVRIFRHILSFYCSQTENTISRKRRLFLRFDENEHYCSPVEVNVSSTDHLLLVFNNHGPLRQRERVHRKCSVVLVTPADC